MVGSPRLGAAGPPTSSSGAEAGRALDRCAGLGVLRLPWAGGVGVLLGEDEEGGHGEPRVVSLWVLYRYSLPQWICTGQVVWGVACGTGLARESRCLLP